MQIGIACRPKPGERACGDKVVVLDGDRDSLLVAVIDGLGHGPKAAEAAEAASACLAVHQSLPLVEMFRQCDRALLSTRGVAMTVLRIDRAQQLVSHAGVGNVQCVSHSAAGFRPVTEAGVVGGRMRHVRPSKAVYEPGDLFVLHSDGISSRLDLGSFRRLGPQAMADAIMAEFGKDHDDASCAVLTC